jgi:hypothetical protein
MAYETKRRKGIMPAAIAAVMAAAMALSAAGCGDRTAEARSQAARGNAAARRGTGVTDGAERSRKPRESAWDRFVRGWHEFWREEFGDE